MDHPYGYEASVAVELAREKIATAIKARHDEIIFTSGATESNNIALIGTMEKYKNMGFLIDHNLILIILLKHCFNRTHQSILALYTIQYMRH